MSKISIIVPVHNVNEFLEECITSLINQTHKNIEIILIDDNSTDGSQNICDKYKNTDNRIIVRHGNYCGPSNARNEGLDIFTGDYFTFVDSDDIVSPYYCEVLLKILSNSKSSFCACKSLRFITGETYPTEFRNLKPYKISNSEFLLKQFNREIEFGTWAKLYKKEIADIIRYKSGKLNEDVFWSADLLKNLNNGVIITDDILYYYRQKRIGSIMTNQAVKASCDLVSASNYLTEIVINTAPELTNRAILYSVKYPLLLIDKIVVQKSYKDNINFLIEFSEYTKKYSDEIQKCPLLNDIQKSRLNLYKKNRILFYFNAYCRLFRVYLYKIIKKDPYKDGHGI